MITFTHFQIMGVETAIEDLACCLLKGHVDLEKLRNLSISQLDDLSLSLIKDPKKIDCVKDDVLPEIQKIIKEYQQVLEQIHGRIEACLLGKDELSGQDELVVAKQYGGLQDSFLRKS